MKVSLCGSHKKSNSIDYLTIDEISYLNDVFEIIFIVDVNNDRFYEFEDEII